MFFSFSIKVFAISACSLLTCATTWAGLADDLMKNGDTFDLKLQASTALSFYLPAAKLEPDNAHLLVCIARQYRHLMADAATREEKVSLGGIALEYARRAAALAPNDSEAQLSPAIAYGKLLPFQSLKEQTETARRIKDGAEKAVRLDPRNDLAWHVLGRWHKVFASLTGLKRTLAQLLFGELPPASNEEAVVCFQKAIEINPTRLMHYVELGQTYAQMGQTAEACRLITKGLAMPDVEKDDPELKRLGRETLAKLQR